MKQIGKRIIHHSNIDSTNNEALRTIRSGIFEGTVIVADAQSNGKGRNENSWASPKGNLYMSIILKPEVKTKKNYLLPFFPCIALYKLIAENFHLETNLKWPNDLIFRNHKLAGILIESSTSGESYNHVIIGIGVNINRNPEVFNRGTGFNSISLGEILDKELQVSEFLENFLEYLNYYYEIFLNEKEEYLILQKANEILYKRGEAVKIDTGEKILTGTISKIDNQGSLEVIVGQELLKISNGSILADLKI